MNTSTAPKVTRVSRKQQVIDAGRAHLKEWLLSAEEHGTIYYNIKSVSRSGMNRKIALSTIKIDRNGKPELVALWPSLRDDAVAPRGGFDFSSSLDVIARDWGFFWDARAFNVSGAGMDMVFWLVDHLASMADMRGDPSKSSYANRVRRESV